MLTHASGSCSTQANGVDVAAEEAISLYNDNLTSPTFVENYGATVFIDAYQDAVRLN